MVRTHRHLSLPRSQIYHPRAHRTHVPLLNFTILISLCAQAKYAQRKLRFRRLKEIKMKYRFSKNPASYADMTMEQAQEVERNMAEYEFPHLWQFGWIFDFLRVSTSSIDFLDALTDSEVDLHRPGRFPCHRQLRSFPSQRSLNRTPQTTGYHSSDDCHCSISSQV